MKKYKPKFQKKITLRYLYEEVIRLRLIQYGLVGVSGALLNVGITWLLTEYFLGVDRYTIAFGIGIVVNIIYNFVLHTTTVFHTKKNHYKRFIIYAIYSLFMLYLQTTTAKIITNIIGDQYYLLVVGGVILFYALFNFVVFKLFLFKEKT